MQAKHCSVTVFFTFSSEISPKNTENAVFNWLFGLIPFLKTDTVLNHSLKVAIKVKFMAPHVIKKQLLYCLVQQILSPKIQVRTLQTILYKFNAKIGRHPAMPFIVMHFKKIKFQRYFWLFRSLSNSYGQFFFSKIVNASQLQNYFTKK